MPECVGGCVGGYVLSHSKISPIYSSICLCILKVNFTLSVYLIGSAALKVLIPKITYKG